MKFIVPSTLTPLLPPGARPADRRRAELELAASSWETMVEEARARFPELAARVFEPSGAIATGIVLVVDGRVSSPGSEFGPTSVVTVVPQLAGG